MNSNPFRILSEKGGKKSFDAELEEAKHTVDAITVVANCWNLT